MLSNEELAKIKVMEKAHAVKILVALRRVIPTPEMTPGMSPFELSALLHLQTQQVHRVIKFLIRLDLVMRQANPPTRTKAWVFYSLTQSGNQMAKRLDYYLAS